MSGEQSISPVLGYRDLDAAVKWLCRAFGFEVRKIDREPSGETRFVSLRLGNASVLVSPAADESLANLFVQPSEVNGGNTQSCYLTVENPDQHCARAVAAGATVEFEPQSDYAGDRFYMCRDIEGHLWTFGTGSYGATVDPAMAAMATAKTSRRPSAVTSISVAALALALGSFAAYGSYIYIPAVQSLGGAPAMAADNRVAVALAIPTVQNKRVLDDIVPDDTAALLMTERAKVAGLQDNMRAINAQLWQLSRTRRESNEALMASNGRLQQLTAQYDLATSEARRAMQSASAAESDKQQALASLETQKSSAANTARVLSQFQHAKDNAEKSAASALNLLAAQRVLINDDRLNLAAVSHRLADEREVKALLQTRVDEMSASLLAMQKQKGDVEHTAELLLQQLSQQIVATQSEHAKLQDARGALLIAQRQIDDLQVRITNASLPVKIRANITPPVSPPVDRTVPKPKPADVSATESQDIVIANVSQSNLIASPSEPSQAAATGRAPDRSMESSRCVGQLLGGKVDWGGGRVWTRANALALCRGSKASRTTLDCFANLVRSGESWKAAITQCNNG